MKEQTEHAKIRQRQRLKQKIKYLINKYYFKALFLTLTFSDEIIANTTEEARERLIKDYLHKNTYLYIANRDYGKKRGREHYHALVVVDTLKADDLKKWPNLKMFYGKIDLEAYTYGKINVKLLNRYDIKRYSADEIAQHFISHYLKDTTKGANIIFSRNKPTKEEQIKRLKERYKRYKKGKSKIEKSKIEEPQPNNEQYIKPMTDEEIILDALDGIYNNKLDLDFLRQIK